MIYIPCHHRQLHNGGWVEEQSFLIAGGQERVAIAPCMLLYPTSGRVQSWMGTLSRMLHRKIVHEAVLRQMLLRRFGGWFDFWSLAELMRGLPVMYQHHRDRYYLLRDVARFLPRVAHRRETFPRTAIQQSHWQFSQPGMQMSLPRSLHRQLPFPSAK
jgi:hypothetical protein